MSGLTSPPIDAEIEVLLARIGAADAAVAADARELTARVMALYESALVRAIEIVGSDRHGDALVERLRRDPLVGSLLAPHMEVAGSGQKLLQISRPPASTATAEAAPGHRCELCGAAVAGTHPHLVDVSTRRLLCACDECGGGRFRKVPSRYVHEPAMCLDAAEWDALGLPVSLAFFVNSSGLGRTVASYPGPAGATESLLPLEAWPALAARHAWMADVAPDVEAVLVHRIGDEYRCHVVPIDVCYELVGRIRRAWTGFGGGQAVQKALEGFFASLLERAGSSARVHG